MSKLFGLKVAKSKQNAFIATGKDLAFASQYKHLKVFAKGFATSNPFDFAHSLGYRPTFAGYIKTNGRYFANYFGNPFDGGSFDNTLYGDIYTTTSILHINCSSTGRLVWICYLNAGDYGGNYSLDLNTKGRYGVRFSEKQNAIFSSDSNIELDTNIETLQIIKQGVITLNIDAIGPTSGTQRKTNFVDYKHGLKQANHFLVPDFFGAGLIAFATEPIGIVGAFVAEDWEISINEENIRFRVSRVAQGDPFFGDASAPARTQELPFFLTNIKLP